MPDSIVVLSRQINMEEYGSCCKQREVLVDKSDRNSWEYPLRNVIDRLHILPYLFLSREDDNEVEHIGRHDFSSVFLHPMLGSLSNHDDDGKKTPTNLHIWQWKTVFFNVWHFVDVLVLSTTWNDQFCSCVDDVSIWWHMFNFVFLCPKRWFQFNSRIVGTHFSSITSLNNWKVIAETRSYTFRWRSRFRRRRVCLSSLLSNANHCTHLLLLRSFQSMPLLVDNWIHFLYFFILGRKL